MLHSVSRAQISPLKFLCICAKSFCNPRIEKQQRQKRKAFLRHHYMVHGMWVGAGLRANARPVPWTGMSLSLFLHPWYTFLMLPKQFSGFRRRTSARRNGLQRENVLHIHRPLALASMDITHTIESSSGLKRLSAPR